VVVEVKQHPPAQVVVSVAAVSVQQTATTTVMLA
jgi:hypothetical protein